jgi:hypothetical protein
MLATRLFSQAWRSWCIPYNAIIIVLALTTYCNMTRQIKKTDENAYSFITEHNGTVVDANVTVL